MSKKLFLLLFTSILFLYRSWEPTIIFTDELFIEDAAFTMSRGGSLIVPMVNGKPDLAKPPLVYWLTAPLYFVFNPQPFLRRVWMVPFGIALVAVTFALAKHWYGRKTASLSGLFLATSTPLIYFTKTGNFDLPNAFFTTITIYFYNLAYHSPKNNPQPKLQQVRDNLPNYINWHYLVLTSLSLGLGILTRSFLALTPLVVIAIDFVLFPKHRPPFPLLFCSCCLLLALILPWHILAYSQAPTAFINQYWQLPLYHAVSLLPGDIPSTPFFYLKVVLIFPLTIFAIIQLLRFYLSAFNCLLGGRNKHLPTKPRSPLNSKSAQLLSWVTVFLTILTISTTRHEWYLLPVLPPLAILAAIFITDVLSWLQPTTVSHFLVVFTVASMVLASPATLLLSSLPQSETVKAVKVMEENSLPEDILYVLRFPLVPLTRFFPKRRVKVINTQELAMLLKNKESFFLIARTNDLGIIPASNNQDRLYQTNEISLIKVKRKRLN